MKTIRKDYPRVRQYVKRGRTYYAVDLRRKNYTGPKWKNFTDRETALGYASEIGEKVEQSGISAITRLTVDPRLVAWTEQAAIFNKTLEEVFNLGLSVCETERQTKESPFVSELLTLWVDDKTTNTLKPLRDRTEKSIRQMANMFKADFKDAKIKELTENRIEDYLKDKDVSNQTKKNIKNYLGQFFNWASKKHYHNHNPVQNIEIHVPNGTPEFFTVDECETIMKRANGRLSGYFALCLFAGIRPQECQQLTWAHIKMDTKEVFIPSIISKTKRDRMFVMAENLFQWLSNCDQNEPLIPTNFRKLKDKALAELGFDWIGDGLRHTFSTFHYARYKNLETLRHIMGNSPKVIERFYKGVVGESEIEKFWSILPPVTEKKEKRFINV